MTHSKAFRFTPISETYKVNQHENSNATTPNEVLGKVCRFLATLPQDELTKVLFPQTLTYDLSTGKQLSGLNQIISKVLSSERVESDVIPLALAEALLPEEKLKSLKSFPSINVNNIKKSREIHKVLKAKTGEMVGGEDIINWSRGEEDFVLGQRMVNVSDVLNLEPNIESQFSNIRSVSGSVIQVNEDFSAIIKGLIKVDHNISQFVGVAAGDSPGTMIANMGALDRDKSVSIAHISQLVKLTGYKELPNPLSTKYGEKRDAYLPKNLAKSTNPYRKFEDVLAAMVSLDVLKRMTNSGLKNEEQGLVIESVFSSKTGARQNLGRDKFYDDTLFARLLQNLITQFELSSYEVQEYIALRSFDGHRIKELISKDAPLSKFVEQCIQEDLENEERHKRTALFSSGVGDFDAIHKKIIEHFGESSETDAFYNYLMATFEYIGQSRKFSLENEQHKEESLQSAIVPKCIAFDGRTGRFFSPINNFVLNEFMKRHNVENGSFIPLSVAEGLAGGRSLKYLPRVHIGIFNGYRKPVQEVDSNGRPKVGENGEPIHKKDDAGNIIYKAISMGKESYRLSEPFVSLEQLTQIGVELKGVSMKPSLKQSTDSDALKIAKSLKDDVCPIKVDEFPVDRYIGLHVKTGYSKLSSMYAEIVELNNVFDPYKKEVIPEAQRLYKLDKEVGEFGCADISSKKSVYKSRSSFISELAAIRFAGVLNGGVIEESAKKRAANGGIHSSLYHWFKDLRSPEHFREEMVDLVYDIEASALKADSLIARKLAESRVLGTSLFDEYSSAAGTDNPIVESAVRMAERKPSDIVSRKMKF
ncbi:TPA: hypothetical protein I7730_00925 [Vibrio vulnificus]|uniref:Uncharacterized protein n=1 Tax=Vibrio vulnificus TaxID=672 RepID=A0A8H9MVG2_VIBVL|nr:hypothetical protein [Vibrio vulnificus]